MGSRCGAIVLAWVLASLLFGTAVLRADVTEEADLREAIVLACHYEMGEFGVTAVQDCIQSETSALTSLSTYPETAKPIVARCTRDNQHRGWSMVKACVDQDIAAEEALQHYPAENQGLVESCRTEFGKRGSVQVKTCVDRKISSQAGGEKR